MSVEAFPRKSYNIYCNTSYLNVHGFGKGFKTEQKLSDFVNRLRNVDFNQQSWLINEMQSILASNNNLNRVE